METMKLQKRTPVATLLDPKILKPAIVASFTKLDPRLMMKNPVMFVVEIVAALTTVILARDLLTGGANLSFTFQIILWLWFTVLFANFAEAVAEGRGKAQADSLRRTRTESQAKLLTADGSGQGPTGLQSADLSCQRPHRCPRDWALRGGRRRAGKGLLAGPSDPGAAANGRLQGRRPCDRGT